MSCSPYWRRSRCDSHGAPGCHGNAVRPGRALPLPARGLSRGAMPGEGLTWGDVAAALPGCQGQHGGSALLCPPQVHLHEAPCDVDVVEGVVVQVPVTVPQCPGDTAGMLGTGALAPWVGGQEDGPGPQPAHWRYM